MKITLSGSSRYYNAYDGSWTKQTHVDGYVEEVFDVRSPLIRNGRDPKSKWRPPSPYSRNIRSGMTSGVYISGRCTQPEWWGTDRGEWAGADEFSGYYYRDLPGFDGGIYNKCLIDARLKLKDQDINLAQAFAERDMTGKMVASRLEDVGDIATKQWRSALKRNSRAGLAEFFGKFLEVQYGWLPLLADVHGAVTALEKSFQRADVVTVKSRASRKQRDERKLTTVVPAGYVHIRKREDIVYRCQVRADYVRSDPISLLTSLGLTNPLALAWEKLPYSFVIDWAYPLGDWFSSLDASLGWEPKGVSISQSVEMKSSAVNDGISPWSTSGGFKGFNTINGRGRQYKFDRSCPPSIPLPGPPPWKTGASGRHVANGIALMSQAILGRLHSR